MTTKYDLAVVGGGIVGLATAYEFLQRFPGKTAIVLEKEAAVAKHQSSRNSGVLHTGMYYKPGSLKATNCTVGKKLMEHFCTEYGADFRICGKLIVATSERELAGLQNIFDRGVANGVTCELVGPEQIKEIEPHVAGVKGIWVKDCGIVDFASVARCMAHEITKSGGIVQCGSAVTAISQTSDGIRLESANGAHTASQMVNAAGLYCDRILEMTGAKSPIKIVPFRGEYYILKKQHDDLCRALIYPVPNPDFPFLGVHFTRGIHGEVECGPNAVLSLAREGYRWRDINVRDFAESITYRGFHNFMRKYWREGIAEMKRSLSKDIFTAALQKLIPEIRSEYLDPGPAGVRAQAMLPDGSLADDFLLHSTPRAVHVLNAPSPAATSSLSVARYIVDKLSAQHV